ncbi:10779_t:CDS:2 [Dentiscutata erythropus]|uniref:10779_t:CDS:1 n=1 Tax=Dentiscutata erythropus TaxID=1348616 RepID=A0A9N8WGD3_9GLOM|nr:10779_t:CDS:2 [Dentiscutata erythropus]
MSSSERELATLRQQAENLQNIHASCIYKNALADSGFDRDSNLTKNSTLTNDNNFLRKKNSSFQQEISNHHNEYARIESELYQQGQEVERLKKENVGFLKNKREVERKLREETQAFEKDRAGWQSRESELTGQVKALQETINVLAQQNEAQKKNGQSSSNDEDSPPLTPTAGSTPSHYSVLREAKTAQRTIKELERRVNELTTEIENAKRAHTDSMNTNKNHVARIHHLENELGQVKHMNQTLMEENEGYQLLLHEKTMKGEFMLNPIMQTNRTNVDDGASIQNAVAGLNSIALDLQAEMKRASDLDNFLQGERVHKESDHTIIEKLQDEIKALKDSNKAMSLYIERILNRIMEAKGFEEILSNEWSAKKTVSSPTSPTTGSFNLSQEPAKKKMERRKTFSSFHIRSASQPQNNLKSVIQENIAEEPEQTRSKENETVQLVDLSKRSRRNSTSTGFRNGKRFSFFSFGMGTKEIEKKDDPHLKQLIIVQENQKE